MKRIFLFLALALLAVSADAQGRYYYDSSHKYGFFSNWTLGVSGQYSNQAGVSNVGLQALATKRVGDYWRLRYECGISGLQQKEGSDRYGTALSGISFDFLPWAYAFADAGMVVNPTSKGWLGLAGDAGIGLNVNFGNYSQLYAELGADRVQNNSEWESTLQCRIGYAARLGITETDRVDIDITRHNAEQLGSLTEENRILKTDLKRKQEENDTLIATLNKASGLFALMEKKLDECNAKVANAAEKNTADNSLFEYYFEYAESELSEIQEARVKELAKYIKSTDDDFRIEGYASPDGNDYNNQRISQERAFAVWNLLKYYDVEESRLVPTGNGVSSKYPADSPLNRRVVVSAIKF